MCGCAKKQALRIGNERSEVRGCPDTEKNQWRVDPVYYPYVEELDQSAFLNKSAKGQIHQEHSKGDGDKKIGFILLVAGKIKKEQGEKNHEHLLDGDDSDVA